MKIVGPKVVMSVAEYEALVTENDALREAKCAFVTFSPYDNAAGRLTTLTDDAAFKALAKRLKENSSTYWCLWHDLYYSHLNMSWLQFLFWKDRELKKYRNYISVRWLAKEYRKENAKSKAGGAL